MAIKDLFSRTAKAITGSPTADEIRGVRREAQTRLTAVEQRLEAIREGGREHTRTLLEGTVDDLAKLDDEAKTLGAELRQLRSRLKELHNKERRARAREAVSSAAELKQSLTKAVDEAEAAEKAYERARRETEQRVRRIREAVRNCGRENIDAGPLLVDAGTIERAAALLPAPGKSQHDTKRELARDIGEPTQAKRQPSGTEKKGKLVAEG